MNALDLFILNNVNKFYCPFLDNTVHFFCFISDNGELWILITITLAVFKSSRKYVIPLIFLIICTMLANNILKDIFARPRPFNLFNNLRIIEDSSNSFSFPSSHSSVACAFWGFLHFLNFKFKWFIFPLAFGITLSRIYLNLHFFTDVIAGIFLGLLLSFLAAYLVKRNSFHVLKRSLKSIMSFIFKYTDS